MRGVRGLFELKARDVISDGEDEEDAEKTGEDPDDFGFCFKDKEEDEDDDDDTDPEVLFKVTSFAKLSSGSSRNELGCSNWVKIGTREELSTFLTSSFPGSSSSSFLTVTCCFNASSISFRVENGRRVTFPDCGRRILTLLQQQDATSRTRSLDKVTDVGFQENREVSFSLDILRR